METQNGYKKMVLRVSAGVGMDRNEFVLVPADMTEEELSDYAWQEALEQGQSYGLEPDSHREFYSEEDCPDDDSFTGDIEGWFEDYDPELHDGLRIGGDQSWIKI